MFNLIRLKRFLFSRLVCGLGLLILLPSCINNLPEYQDPPQPSGYYSPGEYQQQYQPPRYAQPQYREGYQQQGYQSEYQSQGGSRSYSNPYDIPPSRRYNYYDSDQYYVPQTGYRNVEPQQQVPRQQANTGIPY